ncbi:MAG: hypothetical protein GWP91_08795 [Rhodobacterales bacterium]|nr:hypothetical protein [Rhodobacterales bacterium]
MLDAYIIDRIRREQESLRRERKQLPLDRVRRQPLPPKEEDTDENERGSFTFKF